MKSIVRLDIIFIIIFWAGVLGLDNLAAQVEYPGPVNILGPEEIVFDWTTDQCEEVDIPDAPARAFRDADGKVQLIATHYINRRMIGDNLNVVQRDCYVIMDSDQDSDPSKYNDHEWLIAPYTLDGTTIYSLVHNEYQGNSWYNAITFATSTDKGVTYTHDSSPNHLVASIPYVYDSDAGPHGVFGGSNIILNPNDGYYYVLFQVEAYELQDWGVAVARTQTLDDPTSWRAWDGSGFNVQFINPYLNPDADPADHIVQPVSRDHIDKMQSSITYNTFFNKFVLVGPHVGDDPLTGELVYGFFYSLSDDLINWSRAQIIKEAKLWWTPWLSGDAFHYPALIDTSDTTRNFEVTDQQAYLYYTRQHEGTTYDRDLVRIPIEFTRTIVEAFTVNSIGDGEDLNQGDGICNDGNGDCTLRAAIQESNNNPSDVIIPIEFDIPGPGPHTILLSSYLPAITKPAFINGYTQAGSSPNTLPFDQGNNAVLMIEIDGSNTGGAWGLTIRADNTTVRGIAINQFGTDIVLDDVTNNVIQGNFIGTDITGTSNPGAGGLRILGSSNNTIGGTADNTRNIIVGSIEIMNPGANNNIVQGNYIGTDVTGTLALNMSSGVAIQDSAQNNTIMGNLISGNNGHGILMSGYEVWGNSILDNLIGTDLTGINPLGNGLNGIAINDGPQNNIIGTPGQGNIIADSGEEGIGLSGSGTTGNIFQSNYIGTDTTGTVNLGNTFRGVFLLHETGGNKIGGIEDGEGNIIAFNGDIGVGFLSNVGTGNAILSNSIYSNTFQGIDLGLDGISYNDNGDGDGGANNGQNYPELFAATVDTNIVQIAGTMNSSPNTSYRIEFFLNSTCDPSGYGEGEEFIDFSSVATNSSGNTSFYVTFTADVNLGEFITATATDPDGNSSEFSQCVEVTIPESQISIALDITSYWLNVGQTSTEILTISNMGSSILGWSINFETNWINTIPDSGTVIPGITDSVGVIINATNLDEGYYVDTLFISSNDPNSPTIELPVDLFVTSYPEIGVEPDSFIVTLNEGSIGSDTIIIRNVGIATLNWTVGWTSYSPWLSAEPTSGVTEPEDSSLITVTINATDSTVGIYDGVFIINSDDQDAPSIDVPVIMTIVEIGTAEIIVFPDSISVPILVGETFAETLIIENVGTSELEWTVNWKELWLNVNPDSGRTETGSSDSLAVIIDGSELSVGLHIDTLTVSSNDLDNPTVDILVVIDVTDLETDEFSELPKQFELMQNYPNPFNPITTFQYDLPKQADVQIIIYDLLGRKVTTLVSEMQDAGYKSVSWNATDDKGQQVSVGMYFYQIKAGDFTQTRKMVMLK